MEEIDEAIEKLTRAINEAVDRCVTKIRARKMLHPAIDQETRSMMEEAKRIKIQMVNGVDYVNNRRLAILREIIKEEWMVDKVDKEKDKNRKNEK